MNEVPQTFASEAEEAAFWDTHTLGDEILATLQRPTDLRLPGVRPATQPVSIRFGQQLLADLKREAEVSGVPYQTLAKQILAAGLRERQQRRRGRSRKDISAGAARDVVLVNGREVPVMLRPKPTRVAAKVGPIGGVSGAKARRASAARRRQRARR